MYNNNDHFHKGLREAIKAEEQRKGKIALIIALIFFSPIIAALIGVIVL